eukprot:1186582-Prorocentrum_minimum.AAC.4
MRAEHSRRGRPDDPDVKRCRAFQCQTPPLAYHALTHPCAIALAATRPTPLEDCTIARTCTRGWVVRLRRAREAFAGAMPRMMEALASAMVAL